MAPGGDALSVVINSQFRHPCSGCGCALPPVGHGRSLRPLPRAIEAAMTPRRHSTSTRTTPPAAPVTVRTRPISAEAREFATRHGDYHRWSAGTWRTYIELGGAA